MLSPIYAKRKLKNRKTLTKKNNTKKLKSQEKKLKFDWDLSNKNKEGK